MNLAAQSRNPDFASFPFTRPISVGSALPAACQTGQLFFNTAAAMGQNLFGCAQPNAWTVLGNTFTLPPASSSTLGGVIIPGSSGLLVSSGALSVAYGTSSNTALQGSSLGQPSGPASLDASGNIPTTQLHNLGSAAFLNSTAFDRAGAASAAVAAIPSSGSAVTQPALITPSDWSVFNSKQPALGFTPENIVNKNAKSGYAGLDVNGLFPWTQLSGVPTASATKTGVLTSTDWSTFSSKQAALGFTPENSANKGQAGGYASLNSTGQVPSTQLPTIPTKTSQLTNDAGFVNSAQASSAAPVQSVNGQTGAVSIPTASAFNSISSGTNSSAAMVIGSGASLATTGSGTIVATTATQLAANPGGCPGGQFATGITANGTAVCGTPGSSGSGVTTGTAMPSSSSCSSSTLGNLYEQTGSAAQHLWACETNGSTYSWVPMDPNQAVNVMGFGCVANGFTDDSACINKAVTVATALVSNGPASGGDIFLPCASYGIANPIVLPRTGSSPVNSVGILGQSWNCVNLQGLSSFPATGEITNVIISAGGSGYPSSGTTCTITGSGTGATCGVTVSNGVVIGAFITAYGSGYSAAGNACTISGGGGSGATCQAIYTGHAVIEWSKSSVVRNVGEHIRNLTITPPPVAGTGGIWYGMIGPQYNSTGGTNFVNGQPYVVAERMQALKMENIRFLGSNQYNPYHFYLQGDCVYCSLTDIYGDPASTNFTYETVLVQTDTCAFGNAADESCGFHYSHISGVNASLTRGGYNSAFQGRLAHSVFSQAACDGMHGGQYNSSCYIFVNSGLSSVENIENEGLGDSPQVLIENCEEMIFRNVGLGTPDPGAGDGMDLINSNNNRFENHLSDSYSSGAFGAINPGTYMFEADNASHNNIFLNWQNTGNAPDFSVADLSTNFVQWCDATSTTYGTCGMLQTMGYSPGYLSDGGSASITAGLGAGTSPTVSLGSNSGNVAGTITVTTGTSPTASATVATVSFTSSLPTPPVCQALPNNSSAAALSGTALVYAANESTSSFQLVVGSTPLSGSTQYKWKYECLR